MGDVLQVGRKVIRAGGDFFLIAGPCVIESEAMALQVADFLRETGRALEIPIIYKSSYLKANRTSLNSFMGPGIGKGLGVLDKVRQQTGLPVLSDVHCIEEVDEAAAVLDVIQIPAFLCRQTRLLLAAAGTGLPVNLKKGQFLSPWEMETVVAKATSTGNRRLLLTERGSSFGYNNLVVDMRSIAVQKKMGYPVVFDATHSVQLPGGKGSRSGGQREFVGPLAKAAVAAGADGVFMEVHPNPDAALCDGPNSLPLQEIGPLVGRLKEIHDLSKS